MGALFDIAHDPQTICAAAENSKTTHLASCGFSYVVPFGTEERCVSASELLKVATQLFHDCAEEQGWGGCYMLSDGTFLCNFNTGSQCQPLL